MTEHPGGVVVDVHSLIALHDYDYSNNDWMEDFHSITNPAHETTGPDGVLWSTVIGHNNDENNFIQKVANDMIFLTLNEYLEICLQS